MFVGSEVGSDVMQDKGGRSYRAPLNKHLKPSNAFKDYRWYLTRDDKYVILKFYLSVDGKQSMVLKAWSKGKIVQKIITPAYTHDMDFCEIFIVS